MKGRMVTRLTLPIVSLALFAAGDVAPIAVPELPGLGALANLSAIGVLAWWAWSLQSELREQRKEHTAALENIRQGHAIVVDRICERSDKWEQLRHADSEQLSETLRALSANCAATQARLQQHQ